MKIQQTFDSPPFSFEGVGVCVLQMLPVWRTVKALAAFIDLFHLVDLALCLNQ